MPRLSQHSLRDLPKGIGGPAYERSAIRTGVIHFGIGAFHRVHQALVFERALAAGDSRWGIEGVSLRSPDVSERLNAQDHLYTLVERDGSNERRQVIGAVRNVHVASRGVEPILAALADEATHLVTLTVTEKGYLLDPATGLLDLGHPDIAHDVASLESPRTAIGFIVAGLARRRGRSRPPFTAISCDNLPHNGLRLRNAVLAVAEAHDPSLADWIAARGAFPQTMVDRIVPATTEDDIATFERQTGLTDRALVNTETFLQWVVEERFAGEVPDFGAHGASLVHDVAPWEEAKLRLLNGAHSAIAYLGGLAGIEFVHAFVEHEDGRAFIDRLWSESAATLATTEGLDLEAYRRDLLKRFANPALHHRTRQIASDGSQKIPQRLLAPIAARLARGLPIDALGLAVAAWMQWQVGRNDRGEAHTVDDPLAAVLKSDGTRPVANEIDRFLSIEAIFPPLLSEDARFRATLEASLAMLREKGATASLQHGG